ncbi:MAG: hypothetical protein E7340_02845 [Clostridiales bacterium]|nr:hypothetical protein [Clostridiales bacterium]
MFGYVKTDFPNMYMKDVVLYKAMYCGLCKGIGKCCGNKGRLVLNYDLTFLSLFTHNLLNIDVKIEKQTCIIHHIRKRPVAVPDVLTERIGALNVILAYYKLNDDVIDNKKGFIKRSFFKSSYKKAAKKEPKFDAIVKARYAELRKYEKANCDSIDMAADPFGLMMKDIILELIGDDCADNVKKIAYEFGKWIYLIDALDDFDKDKKKKNYNVFVNANPDVCDKQTLLMTKGNEIVYIFGTILNEISTLEKGLDYKFNHDLISNILSLGLKGQTKVVMENKKCKNTSKF